MSDICGVGIIGFGKMGSAIAQGLIRAGFDPSRIAVSDKVSKAIELAKMMGINNAFYDNCEVVKRSNIIFIAVRPHIVETVVKEIAPLLKGKILISVAAMVPLRKLSEVLAGVEDVELYRIMPNINVAVNRGFVAATHLGEAKRRSLVERILSYLGDVVWVQEELMDAISILASCTPAIVAELIDALVLAGVRLGIPHDLARRIASKVFEGTAVNVLESGSEVVRNSVVTPKGITIRLIEKFMRENIKYLVVKTLVETYTEVYGEER